MAKLASNYELSSNDSPTVSDENLAPLPTSPVTQTPPHPYWSAQVRMRKKGIRVPREDETQNSAEPSLDMLNLQAELNNTKSELKRQTVLFSTHYSEIVGKWKNEKNKREVAETVAVEKARDCVVLQRTQITLGNRVKQSAKITISRPTEGAEGTRGTGGTGGAEGTEGGEGGEGGEGREGGEGGERKDEEGGERKDEEGGERKDEEGEKKLVELTQENEKLNLENQDLNETVKLMEEQITEFKQEAEEQSAGIQELRAKLSEMELESMQSKSYMLSAQQQYKNLAGRLHDEKGKREIAESVAVNKARELEVQKRTSVMFLSSISNPPSSDIFPDNIAPSAPLRNTMEFASKVSSLEAELEDLKESRQVLESALEKYEQDSERKDQQIRDLREKLFLGSFTRTINVEECSDVTHSQAIHGCHSESNELLLSTETASPLLLQSFSSGGGDCFAPGNFPGHSSTLSSTLGRPKKLKGKVSAIQSTEQLQKEIKVKEATISIMREKLGRMKLEGSRADTDLEEERKELEDQVGGLDKKLSTLNTGDKEAESEVDELREKLENVERKAADFEEKSRYYQELLNKMDPVSESPRTSLLLPVPVSPADIPLPPPNIPPPPPPPLPEGLFGPATPQILPRAKASSRVQSSDTRDHAMSELMTVLNSGKVNLKKAINRAPVKKESESESPVLFTHIFKRQITEPGAHPSEGMQDQSVVFRSVNVQNIETKLLKNRRQKDSDGKSVSSELASKLDRRRQVSEKPSKLNPIPGLPKIDSSPLPPAQLTPVNEPTSKPQAVRKVTPVPTPLSSRPQSVRKQTEPISEEIEEPIDTPTEQPVFTPVTDKSPLSKLDTSNSSPVKSPLPKLEPFTSSPVKSPFSKQEPFTSSPIKSPLSKQDSSNSSPIKSPFFKQDSFNSSPLKPPIPREKKPSFKTPILPPANRELVPIQALRSPSPDEKRSKSGSNPNPLGPTPSSPRPNRLFGVFKKEKSLDGQQKESRSSTEGDIDSIDPSDGKGPQKLKIPQAFSKK